MSSEGQAVATARARDPDSFETQDEKVPLRYCFISLEDFLIWDNWITWEQELDMHSMSGMSCGPSWL